VPRTALATPIRNSTVLEVARQALTIARAGLVRRGRHDKQGRDETRFLEPIEAILSQACTPAEEILSRYEKAWGRSTGPLFTEFSF
jgi:glutamate--cysteine ligase